MRTGRTTGKLNIQVTVDVWPHHAAANLDIQLREVLRRDQPEIVVPQHALLLELFSELRPFRGFPGRNYERILVPVEMDEFLHPVGRGLFQIYLEYKGKGVILGSAGLQQQIRIERRIVLSLWYPQDVEKDTGRHIRLAGNQRSHQSLSFPATLRRWAASKAYTSIGSCGSPVRNTRIVQPQAYAKSSFSIVTRACLISSFASDLLRNSRDRDGSSVFVMMLSIMRPPESGSLHRETI